MALFGKHKRQITRLLLVEDEPLIAFDTEHLLDDEGYTVVATVDRVSKAVALIESGTELHLVLVDVSLADGSGIEVARAASARDIPALFVTGNCPVGGSDFAAGCLSKPYAPRDLLASIAAIEAVRAGRKTGRLPHGLRLFSTGTA